MCVKADESRRMRRTKIFAGSSHEVLASRIAQQLGVGLGKVKLGMTRTFETHVVLQESVRDEKCLYYSIMFRRSQQFINGIVGDNS